MIYADHAATTRISATALSAMEECMQTCWGNPSSLYTLGRQASETLQKSRETIARCLGASPKEIFFTSGGSESDNQAILSAAHAGAAHQKKHLIASAIEHHAVLHTLEALEVQGFEVTLLPVGQEGLVNPSELEAAIREDTALVSIMMANNEIGTIQPVAALGEICRKRGILFHTDAVQAVGHLPIQLSQFSVAQPASEPPRSSDAQSASELSQLPIDLLSLSAHKFHGPRGIGALYVRNGVPVEPLIYGGAQERGRRAGTENLPAIAGMAAALEECCKQMEASTSYVKKLRDQLWDGLSRIPGVILNGSPDHRLPGNLNLSIPGCDAEMMLLLLDQRGIAASSGSACTSGSLKPSHVLLALGRSQEEARASLRLTLDVDNTPEEIDAIIVAVKEVIKILKQET